MWIVTMDPTVLDFANVALARMIYIGSSFSGM
jgi:hypothetical protein